MKVYRLFLATFLISSCIQIPIGNNSVDTYNNIVLKAPKSPFKPFSSAGSDQSWIDSTTGNIISYRSECPTQVSELEDHLTNLSSQFINATVINQDSFSYNSRKALRYDFNGDLEGIATTFETVSFKKYGCFFILTHNGKKEQISKTSENFNSFVETFTVKK